MNRRLQQGVANWVYVVVVIAVIVVIAAVVFVGSNLANDASGGTSGGTAGTTTCFTKCVFFQEYRCEDNVRIGWCAYTSVSGGWSCSDRLGLHTCAK